LGQFQILKSFNTKHSKIPAKEVLLLELGIFNHFPYQYINEYHDFPRPNKQFDPEKGHALYLEYLDEFELADKLGFDVLAFNEHHSKEYNLDVGPALIASYLIARTKRARILPTGAILPLHNPIRIAEEYAMLDVISGGRLIAGFERGGITNYLAYSVPVQDKARFDEAWDLIVRAWTERQPFQWDGKYYHFNQVSIWPRPYQQPHPPIHTAGPSAAFAAEKDASYGLWVQPTSEIEGTWDTYREAYVKAHSMEPSRDRVSLIRSVYVSENDDRAEKESADHILYTWKTLWRPSMLAVKKVEDQLGRKLFWASRLPLTEMNYDGLVDAGLHIAGNPESVIEKILEQQKKVGFGTFIGEFRFGQSATPDGEEELGALR
jgi:alkanesulfonate monooxygenase SsuD/methylene tetrahydromethanopterin reductase-like flavin-dependent oxidoreductase (luciferase family)